MSLLTPYEKQKMAAKILAFSTERVIRQNEILATASKNTEIAREAIRDFHSCVINAMKHKNWSVRIFHVVASFAAKRFPKQNFDLSNDAVFAAQFEVYKFNIAYESKEFYDKFLYYLIEWEQIY